MLPAQGKGIGEAGLGGSGKSMAASFGCSALLHLLQLFKVAACALGCGCISGAAYLIALKQVNVPSLQILSLFFLLLLPSQLHGPTFVFTLGLGLAGPV